MRLQQVDNISAARYLALFVGGVLLTRSLIQMPLQGVAREPLLGIFAGLTVLPFLHLSFALRYISVWLVLAGGGGLFTLAGNHLEPFLGNPKFLIVDHATELIAVALYILFLFAGLVIMRYGPAAKPIDSPVGDTSPHA